MKNITLLIAIITISSCTKESCESRVQEIENYYNHQLELSEKDPRNYQIILEQKNNKLMNACK